MKKNTHYFNGQKSKRKIVYGKEKAQEYNAISQEIEKTFCNWLDFAGVDVGEFDRRMKAEPHRVEESINADGDIEINIFAGNEQVIVPLVFQPNSGGNLDDFIVNALLLFSHIAARYESKSFEKAVTVFADRMIAEKKVSV